MIAKNIDYVVVFQMFMSNQAEEQHKYGERVAYLQLAVDKHNEAVKLSKVNHYAFASTIEGEARGQFPEQFCACLPPLNIFSKNHK